MFLQIINLILKNWGKLSTLEYEHRTAYLSTYITMIEH